MYISDLVAFDARCATNTATIANTAATAFADASIVAGFQPTHPTPESKPRNSFAAPRPPSDSAITLAAQCGDPA